MLLAVGSLQWLIAWSGPVCCPDDLHRQDCLHGDEPAECLDAGRAEKEPRLDVVKFQGPPDAGTGSKLSTFSPATSLSFSAPQRSQEVRATCLVPISVPSWMRQSMPCSADKAARSWLRSSISTTAARVHGWAVRQQSELRRPLATISTAGMYLNSMRYIRES